MNSLSPPTARKPAHLILAVFVGAVMGVMCCASALIAVNVTASHSVEPEIASPPAASTETRVGIQTPITRTPTPLALHTPTRLPTVNPGILPIQPTVALRGIKHDYQRWNNCGPTTLEMNLSFFGRTATQAEIAAFTKPNPNDHNVRPDELVDSAQRAGLHAIIGIDGTLDRLKLVLSNGLPVIVETSLLTPSQGWIGHYRLLIGYDATHFNTMDSLNGANVRVSIGDLDAAWRDFNRLYVIVYTDADAARIRAIAPEAFDPLTMYSRAVIRAQVEANPNDAFAQFNLGSSLLGLKRYADAASAFDRARAIGLPFRMMWYQFGPYEAYLRAGRYADVITLADATLRMSNDLEESHYYKGLALRALGREAEAREEFQAALRYNKNYRDAQRALQVPIEP